MLTINVRLIKCSDFKSMVDYQVLVFQSYYRFFFLPRPPLLTSAFFCLRLILSILKMWNILSRAHLGSHFQAAHLLPSGKSPIVSHHTDPLSLCFSAAKVKMRRLICYLKFSDLKDISPLKRLWKQ